MPKTLWFNDEASRRGADPAAAPPPPAESPAAGHPTGPGYVALTAACLDYASSYVDDGRPSDFAGSVLLQRRE